MERSADGTLTGYTLPPAVRWETLSPLLRVEENGGRWYAMLGRELVDTDELIERRGDMMEREIYIREAYRQQQRRADRAEVYPDEGLEA